MLARHVCFFCPALNSYLSATKSHSIPAHVFSVAWTQKMLENAVFFHQNHFHRWGIFVLLPGSQPIYQRHQNCRLVAKCFFCGLASKNAGKSCLFFQKHFRWPGMVDPSVRLSNSKLAPPKYLSSVIMFRGANLKSKHDHQCLAALSASQKAQRDSGCVILCLSLPNSRPRLLCGFQKKTLSKSNFLCQNVIYSISLLSPNSVVPLPCPVLLFLLLGRRRVSQKALSISKLNMFGSCPVLLFLLEGGQRALKKQCLCHKCIRSASMSCPSASSSFQLKTQILALYDLYIFFTKRHRFKLYVLLLSLSDC